MLLLPQLKLYDLFHIKNIGSAHGKNLMLYFSFEKDKTTCSKCDFTPYLNNFSDFQVIQH